ncbi:MAG: hypothetical protein AAGE65_08920 [Planctomycetota bacterium]
MPLAALRAKRDAGLFSRWHEASADETRWVPIDDAVAAEERLATSIENHRVDSADEDASGQAVDWDALTSGPLKSEPTSAVTAATLRPWQDLSSVTAACAAALWLTLLFVPTAWQGGRGVRPWSWPSELNGMGVALAQAWWALLGVGLAAAVALQGKPLGAVPLHPPAVAAIAAPAVPGRLGVINIGSTPAPLVGLVGAAIFVAWLINNAVRRRIHAKKLGAFAPNTGLQTVSRTAALSALLLGFAWWWGGTIDGRGPAFIETSRGPAAVSERTHAVLIAAYLISHSALALLLQHRHARDARAS